MRAALLILFSPAIHLAFFAHRALSALCGWLSSEIIGECE